MLSIESLLSESGYSTLILILLAVLTIGIDAFNITNIEKLMLENSKKMLIQLGNIVFCSLISTIILMLMVFDDFKQSHSLSSFLLVSFITVFLGVLVLYIPVFSLIHLCTLKFNYYLTYDNKRWRIIKRVDKDKLLLGNENIGYKIVGIDNIHDNIIFVELRNVKNERFQWLYFSNTVIKVIKGLIVILTAVVAFKIISKTGSITSEDAECRGMLVFMMFLVALSLVHGFLVYNNKKIVNNNKKLIETKWNKTN